MSAFRDLSISKKFLYTFGANCLLCALLGAAAATGLMKVNSAVDKLVTDSMPSMKVLGDIRYGLATVRRTDALLLLCDTSECTTHYQEMRTKYIGALNSDITKYAPMVGPQEEREFYNAIRDNGVEYLRLSDKGNGLAGSGQHEEALRVLMDKQTLAAYNGLLGAVQKDIDLNNQMGSEQAQKAVHLGHVVLLVVGILMVLAVALCATIGSILTHMIAPPLRAATAALEHLAKGDLTAKVEENGEDELGHLSRALNASVDEMRSVLRTMAETAETLSSATEEMSAQTAQTSGNAETQSGRTSQIAAAAQEMTATIGEISQNAESAAVASRQSAEAATEGGTVMETVNATMERIGTATTSVAERMSSLAHRSREIGRVVTVIQEISEQTNLLALNAAIEAARAGEHGRGFAVVAGEVRRLAERTKGATEEISATIRTIQEETSQTVTVMDSSRAEVQSGVEQTAGARASLTATIKTARNVEQMIHLIATAATEQTAASAEISESATDISKLAAESSMAALQAAEACKNLSELATRLDGVIRHFRLDEETTRVANHSNKPAVVRSPGLLRAS